MASKTTAEAVAKAHRLYRAAWREAPFIVREYMLDITVADLRACIRYDFSRHQTTEPEIIDRLVYMGERDLYEAQLLHKQPHHILDYINEMTPEPELKLSPIDSFRQEFEEGTLEELR